MFENIKVGDPINRLIGGQIPMQLKVTGLTDDRIICGPWEFSRKNGAEIDEDLGWDEHRSGSYIEVIQ